MPGHVSPEQLSDCRFRLQSEASERMPRLLERPERGSCERVLSVAGLPRRPPTPEQYLAHEMKGHDHADPGRRRRWARARVALEAGAEPARLRLTLRAGQRR